MAAAISDSASSVSSVETVCVDQIVLDRKDASLIYPHRERIFSAIRTLQADSYSEDNTVVRVDALGMDFFIKKADSLEHAQFVSDLSRKELAPKMYCITQHHSSEFYMVFERYDASFVDVIYHTPLQFIERVERATEFLRVLATLHAENKAHGNINPEKIVFSHEGKRVRLVDFPPPEREGKYTVEYLCLWKALAIKKGERQTIDEAKAADVYSAALVVYNLLTCLCPVVELRVDFIPLREAMFRTLAHVNPNLPPYIRDFIGEVLCSVLIQMPQNRPTANEFLQRMQEVHALLEKHSARKAESSLSSLCTVQKVVALHRAHVIVEQGSLSTKGSLLTDTHREVILSAIRGSPLEAASSLYGEARVEALGMRFCLQRAPSSTYAKEIRDLSENGIAPEMYFIARRSLLLFYMVFEKYDVTFLDVILSTSLSVQKKFELAAEFLGVLAKFHDQGPFHGEIRPENIVLSHQGDRVRLVNFSNSIRTDLCGFGYLEPVKTYRQAAEADVYAAALVVFRMLTRQLIPQGVRKDFGLIQKGVRINLSHEEVGLPPHIQSLVAKALCRVLAQNPGDRAMAREFFQRMHWAHVLLKIHSARGADSALSRTGSPSASSSSSSQG